MADYWCSQCGGRTAMLGHTECDQYLLGVIDRLCEIYPTMPRRKAIEAIGRWQIGDRQLPPTDELTHLAHCNMGEYVGLCKYGDTDCPALPTDDWELEQRVFSACFELRPGTDEIDPRRNASGVTRVSLMVLVRDLWKAYCAMEQRAKAAEETKDI